jgi:hypothetical protein
VIVAPTQDSRADAHNTVRQELVIVGCANLKETNFAFDSSVVDPKAQKGFRSLAVLLQKHVGSPMTIFGHADPTGQGDVSTRLHYNHILSERRARAIFAVLVRDTSIWEKLFTNQEGALGDVWGPKSLQLMHEALGDTSPIVNTPAARATLFARYMDFLRGAPSSTPPFPSLTPNDFLGRGKQKATLQGCSSFNPQLLMSKAEQKLFDKDPAQKDARNSANEPNRRVVIYLFAKGTVIDPSRWPCPAIAEREGACTARQWSNGEARRTTLFEQHRRRFGRAVPLPQRTLVPANPTLADEMGVEETTFGCRFYHGVALHSPCERDLKMWAITLLVDAPAPLDPVADPPPLGKQPLANRRFVATIGTSPDAPVVRGRTTAKGLLALPLFDPNVVIKLKLDVFAALTPPPPPPPANSTPPAAPTTDSERDNDEDTFLTITLAAGALKPVRLRDSKSLAFDPDFDDDDAPPLGKPERDLAGLQRLFNLGFGRDDTGGPSFSKWSVDDRQRFIKQFQRTSKLPESGVIDDATANALFTTHGS